MSPPKLAPSKWQRGRGAGGRGLSGTDRGAVWGCGGASGAPWTMRLTSDLEIWLLPSTTSQMYFPVSSRVTVLKRMLVDVNWTRSL